MKRRVGILAQIVVVVGLHMTAGSANAHCPGGPGPGNEDDRWYASGGYLSSSAGNAITAMIQWTNPTTCPTNHTNTGFSAHGITLCNVGSCGYHVQVGWIDRVGYSTPQSYCEFNGGSGYWDLREFALPGTATYSYKFQYDTVDKYWDCYVNGSVKASHTMAYVHMSKGTYFNAQGETNATHGQIGKMSPSKLLISDLTKRIGTIWSALNVVPNSPVSPYGVDEPATGQLRMWTIGH